MGIQFKNLSVLILLVWLSCMWPLRAQSTGSSSLGSARALDALLQDYAYQAFVNPRTGVPFDSFVPSNLTGIKIASLRLRTGSLKVRGVESYKEFEIPTGVVVKPYVERLVLVYQNLGNWSSVYYPLSNHTYLSPLLGLLAYSATNLSATNLPELDFRAIESPILIHYSELLRSVEGLRPRCVWFDLNGTANFSDVVSSKTCETTQQGHFALVVEGILPPAPAPAPAPVPAPVPSAPEVKEKKKKKHISSKVWIIMGSVVGGVILLALLAVLLGWLRKYNRRKKIQRMQNTADSGEALRQTTVGRTKAPAAFTTRTQPALETEYVP